jgi:dienelactone hydrolase
LGPAYEKGDTTCLSKDSEGKHTLRKEKAMKRMRGVLLAMFVAAFAVTAEGKVVTEEVPYEHKGVNLMGFLAYDDDLKEKTSAVLLVHEWWGLNEYAKDRAGQLAAKGYVAFALDMYGEGKVTTHPQQASEWAGMITGNVSGWQERANAGLEILRKDPRVDPERIAAIGYCFGGATVQQMAYSGADLRGVVSFHGSLLPVQEDQVKQVKAKILILHGASDPLIEEEQIQTYVSAMEASGLDWQMVFYGGAKHSFTNPDADKAGMDALGYSASADARSWAHMKIFFEEVISE